MYFSLITFKFMPKACKFIFIGAFYNVFIACMLFSCYCFFITAASYPLLHCSRTTLSWRSHRSLFKRIITCSQCARMYLYVVTTTKRVVYTAHLCTAAVGWLRPHRLVSLYAYSCHTDGGGGKVFNIVLHACCTKKLT